MEKIIGREDEKKILEEALLSNEPELIAIYGRRRIGKSFLIRNYYQKGLVIEFMGVHGAGLKEQLQHVSFGLQTPTGFRVHTIITTYGTRKNEHYLERIQAEVLMEDLFTL